MVTKPAGTERLPAGVAATNQRELDSRVSSEVIPDSSMLDDSASRERAHRSFGAARILWRLVRATHHRPERRRTGYCRTTSGGLLGSCEFADQEPSSPRCLVADDHPEVWRMKARLQSENKTC